MSRVLCEEQQKLLLSLKKSLTLRDKIDIDNTPPRKLLTRRQPSADMFSDEDPYSSDQFRMYEFKIRRCTRSRSHDWTDCPFAHPGEKARRRDPLKYQYSGEVCPDYRRGNCERGDACEFSHGVFECWLHPSRYRTEACKDGKNCKRKICFFAHTPRQLRVLLLTPPQNNINNNNNNNNNNNKKSHNNNNCCSYCHCCSSNSSPTSTLFSGSHFSKSNSPPLSPSSSSSSPTTLSRYSKNMHVLNELMRSIELESALNSPVSAAKLPWLDVNVSDQYSPFGCEDHSQNHVIDVSPTMNCGKYYSSDDAEFSREQRKMVGDDDVIAVPDFGWVNDLLM